jgi:hypothetical protein
MPPEKSDIILALESSARITAEALLESARIASKNNAESIAAYGILKNDIEYIKKDVTEIKERLEGQFVSKDEFEPVKKIVYGLVGIILVAVVGALIALVVRGS